MSPRETRTAWRRVVHGGARARLRLLLRAGFAVGMAVVFLWALFVRFEQTRGSSPYPRHVDEHFILDPALRIAQQGDLHPGKFNYPSLPTYLAVGAIALGSLRAASHEELTRIREVRLGYPHHSHPTVGDFVRDVWGLAAALSLVLACLLASRWSRSRSAAFVVAALLLFHPKLISLFRYINVDTIGTALALAALLYVVLPKREGDVFGIALAPGLLVGLATSSKYTYAVLLVTGLLSVWVWSRQRRSRLVLALLVAAAFGFLLGTPYALLDLPAFIDGVAAEVRHYAEGHRGHEGDPGFSQARRYLASLTEDHGALGWISALLGLAFVVRKRPRSSLLVLSSTALLLYMMAQQKVFFIRNLLLIWHLYAVLLAIGVLAALPVLLRRYTRRWLSAGQRRWSARLVPLGYLALLWATFAFTHEGKDLAPDIDSRNRVVDEVNRVLPPGASLLLPVELGVYRGRLREDLQVTTVESLAPKGRRLPDDRVLGALAAFEEGWVIRPRFGADRRRGHRGDADHLNRLWRRLDLDVEFEAGSRDVLVNYTPRTTGGDPRLELGRLRAPLRLPARPPVPTPTPSADSSGRPDPGSTTTPDTPR